MHFRSTARPSLDRIGQWTTVGKNRIHWFSVRLGG